MTARTYRLWFVGPIDELIDLLKQMLADPTRTPPQRIRLYERTDDEQVTT